MNITPFPTLSTATIDAKMLSDSGWRRMISPVRCRIRLIASYLQEMRLCRLSMRHVRLLAISKFLY